MRSRNTTKVYNRHPNNKSSFWKRENRRKRVRKLVKLFFLIVVLFAFVNLLLKVPGWFQNINRPFESVQSSIDEDGKVNGSYRTNILLVSVSTNDDLQDLALASFNSDKDSVVLVRIPIGAKTFLQDSGQDLSLGATYFSKPYFDSGFDSVYLATSELLALPLDGYFVFVQDQLEFTEETIVDFKNKSSSIKLMLNVFNYKSWLNENMKTNYSTTKIFGLARSLRSMNIDKLEFSQLAEAVEDKQFIYKDIDKLLQANVLDTVIANEAAVVELSGENNFSGVVERVVNNLGASVINVGPAEDYPETKVILGSDKNKAAERLARFLKVELEKSEVRSGADIRVEIGEDFVARFYGR